MCMETLQTVRFFKKILLFLLSSAGSGQASCRRAYKVDQALTEPNLIEQDMLAMILVWATATASLCPVVHIIKPKSKKIITYKLERCTWIERIYINEADDM